MKLIELYIENFGGLSQFALDFETGLTTLVQPNGFGKTTLAEFIRAMFYGFPRKSKALEKSLRQKYAPWNGGPFGGNLVFEYEGCRYRVERSFGQSPKGDTFTLTDLGTNRPTDRFNGELGEALFGLDADSFERSVYLPQLPVEGPLATAAIAAKLSDLVEDNADVGNYDKAMASLRAKRSAMIPYRGSGGSVAQLSAKITQLQLQLDEATAQEEERNAQQSLAERARCEAEAAQTELSEIGQLLELAARQEADCLLQQQYAQLQLRHQNASARAQEIRKRYPRGLPSEASFQRASDAARCLENSGGRCPTQEQLEYCRSTNENYFRLNAEIRQLRSLAEQSIPSGIFQTAPAEKKNPAVWLLGAAGLLLAAVFFFLRKLPAAAVALGVAAALLIAGTVRACLQSRKKRVLRREMEDKEATVQQQIRMCRDAAEECRGELESFCQQFVPGFKPGDYGAALAQMEQLRGASAALKAFFSELETDPAQDLLGGIRQLREDMLAAQTAKTLLQELEAQLEDMESSYGDVLFAEYSPIEDTGQLRERERTVRGKLTEATARMLRAQQNAQLLSQRTESVGQLREELESCRHEMRKQREDAQLLDDTMGFLQQARENLSTAYMGTVRSGFARYVSELTEDDGEKILVDPDMRVQLERQGRLRELAYFSAGQTDLIRLCMRLALVDALFRDQRMFVILDDPFVNLDDAHLCLARDFLRKLAARRQILYLTCHSGRSI